jgi:hypothetical protein
MNSAAGMPFQPVSDCQADLPIIDQRHRKITAYLVGRLAAPHEVISIRFRERQRQQPLLHLPGNSSSCSRRSFNQLNLGRFELFDLLTQVFDQSGPLDTPPLAGQGFQHG